MYDLYLQRPELFVKDKNGQPVVPADWTDVRLFDSGNETKINPDVLKVYKEYVDMVKAGILDPAKVTRSALQNATSVASTLLTTESVVANIKEETPAMPAGGAGMGGMM